MKINRNPQRVPDAARLLPDTRGEIGAVVMAELAQHIPVLKAVTHGSEARWWICLCEVSEDGEQLPPMRSATGWESHAFGCVVAALLGLAPKEAAGIGAAVHGAHFRRVAVASRTEPAGDVVRVEVGTLPLPAPTDLAATRLEDLA